MVRPIRLAGHHQMVLISCSACSPISHLAAEKNPHAACPIYRLAAYLWQVGQDLQGNGYVLGIAELVSTGRVERW